MALDAALLRLVVPHRPGFVNLTALIVLYFLPTLIAALRRSTMTGWVALINLLAGWTVVGWLVALVMAIASSRKQATVVVNLPPPPPPPPGSSPPGSESR
jgi:T4 superinfection immunity protein